MTYDEHVTDGERKIARWLAVAMHVAFVLLLVFGVAWQKRHSEPAAIVDLWSNLAPTMPEPPAPAPRPEPKVERKADPTPPPKSEVKPVPKPDIALREKLEKERKVKEQQELEKKKLAELKKKEDEAKKLKAEAKKKDDTAEKDRLAKEVELKRLAQDQEVAKRLAAEKSAAQSRIFEEYVRQIQNKVKRNISPTANVPSTARVELEVKLLPGGDVLDVKVRRPSGVPAYDDAVERAIRKSSPLPVPSDSSFDMFRTFILKHQPE